MRTTGPTPPHAASPGRPGQPSACFGARLRTARLDRGISLERIAAETRIRPDTLRAIEEEDFGRLPPEPFLSGFLRSFSQAVGVEAEETLDCYRRCRGICGAGTAEAVRTAERRAPRGLRLFLISLLGFALLVGGSLAAYRLMAAEGRSPSSPQARAELSAFPLPAPAAQEAVLPPPPGLRRHELSVTALEDAWIKVSTDHGSPREYLLRAGMQLTLEADSGFNLLLGNAGGLRLALDGKPLPPAGRRGQIVNLHLP